MNAFRNQRSWQVAPWFVAVAALLLAWSVTLHAVASESPFPVHVSANGRYLEDASGKPFLLHGDTAWSLMVQLTREETEEYLENRRKKGFNAILVQLIQKSNADNPPNNAYGDAPFTRSGDFSTPNEAYFAHVDWVIQKANEKGILVVLNPAFTGQSNTNSPYGWIAEIIANGPTKCRNYGRYVGNRYKNFTNIIWQAVGDMTLAAGASGEKNWLEILKGIRDFAPSHHWTAHYKRFSTALEVPAFAPQMTLDNTYTGTRPYIRTLMAYNRNDHKPTFLNEAGYEDDTPARPPALIRAQTYWTLLSGATGHFFGSDYIHSLGGPRGSPSNPLPVFDWRGDGRPGIERNGSCQSAFPGSGVA